MYSKFLFCTLFFFLSVYIFGQINYSYTDPCTGSIKTINVPSNGVTVTYYGEINTFQPGDFYNGVFESWAQGVYSSYGNNNPCATIVGLTTGVNIAQSTTINFLGIINSLDAVKDLVGGSTNILSGVDNTSRSSGDGKKEDKKKNNNNNVTNNQNSSGNSSETSISNGNSAPATQNQGSQVTTTNEPQENTSNTNVGGTSSSVNTNGNSPGESSSNSSQNNGNQNASGENGQTGEVANSGTNNQSNGTSNSNGGSSTTSTGNSSSSENSQSGGTPEGNTTGTGGTGEPTNNTTNNNSSSTESTVGSGSSTESTGGSGSSTESTGGSGSSTESTGGSGSSTESTGGSGSSTTGNSNNSGNSQGGSNGEGESNNSAVEETPVEDAGGGKTNIVGSTTNNVQTASNNNGNRPNIIASSDFVGFNFKNSDVSYGGKVTGGYTSARWDGKRASGVLCDYTTALKGPNISGFYAFISKKRIDLISTSLTIGFDRKPTVYGTLALGQMWNLTKSKKAKALYMLTASVGSVYGERFVGTAAIAGGMYDIKIGKRIDIKLMGLYVYAPYVSYYNDILLKSPHVVLPIIGTNVGITKKFKININGGGAWALNENALNYTIMFGTRMLL